MCINDFLGVTVDDIIRFLLTLEDCVLVCVSDWRGQKFGAMGLEVARVGVFLGAGVGGWGRWVERLAARLAQFSGKESAWVLGFWVIGWCDLLSLWIFLQWLGFLFLKS